MTRDRKLKKNLPRARHEGAEGQSSRERLLVAAREEFEQRGYLGTHTNHIARAARFSPQTFYRYFPNKLAIFEEVYRQWLDESWRRIAEAAAQGGSLDEMAARIGEGVESHYRDSGQIRASVRMLLGHEPAFRALYLSEGRKQIETTRANRASRGQRARPVEEHLVGLMVVERLADALAFGEVEELGGDPDQMRLLLARFVAAYVSDAPLWG